MNVWETLEVVCGGGKVYVWEHWRLSVGVSAVLEHTERAVRNV